MSNGWLYRLLRQGDDTRGHNRVYSFIFRRIMASLFMVALYLTILTVADGYLDGVDIPSMSKYLYGSQTTGHQIQKMNMVILEYYSDYVEPYYDKVLVSPVAVQSALYNEYERLGEEHPEMFMGLGHRSWCWSGVVFRDPCLYYTGADTEDIGYKLNILTEGFVDIEGLGSGVSGAFALDGVVLGGLVSGGSIYYDGDIRWGRSLYSEVVVVPLEGGYSLGLVNGDVSDILSVSLESKEAVVRLEKELWRSKGGSKTLEDAMESNISITAVAQLGVTGSGILRGNLREPDYIFDKGYGVVVFDPWGLILAVGKR